MRFVHEDLGPILSIIAGGAVGVLISGSFLLSARADHMAEPIQPVSEPTQHVWSPDGSSVVFRASEDMPPTSSPDGTWIAFVSGGQLMVVPSEGGEPVHIRPFTAESAPGRGN